MLNESDKTYKEKAIVPRKMINPEAAFEAWITMGSLDAASKYLMDEKGMYNIRRGKQFSKFAVRHAACRYIAIHHEEAKPALKELWARDGVEITNEDWKKFVVDIASRFLDSSKERFLKWLDANPWAEEYDYIYARRFGLEPKNRPKF